MLRISGLEKSYKGFRVLKGLNMSINKGDVYGFIGRNGCGKTTTMNIICDIIPKDSGDIEIAGGENKDRDRDRDNKVRIGYLPESPSLFSYMNGYEYLNYIAACSDFEGDITHRTAEVLDIVGLTSGASRRIKGYSRGMNQRLGIAAAIYANPDLLILDEPTSALDPEGRAEVMVIIQRLKQTETTILLCTHILSDIERVANRIGILSGGVMADEGGMDDVIGRHSSGTAVNVKLANHTPENIAILKNAELVTDLIINTSTGALTISGSEENGINALCSSLIKTMAENSIIPESLSINKPDLEQVYLNIVGEEKKLNGRRTNI